MKVDLLKRVILNFQFIYLVVIWVFVVDGKLVFDFFSKLMYDDEWGENKCSRLFFCFLNVFFMLYDEDDDVF